MARSRRATAVHEAGHMVVLLAAGCVEIASCACEGGGYTSERKPAFGSRGRHVRTLREELRHAVRVCAGPFANVHDGEGLLESRRDHGYLDWREFNEFSRTLNRPHRVTLLRAAWNHVGANGAAIEILAGELLSRFGYELNGRDAFELTGDRLRGADELHAAIEAVAREIEANGKRETTP